MARSGRPLKVEPELEFLDNYIDNDNFSEIENLIEQYGVNCYDSNKRTFLIVSAAKGNVKTLKFVLERGSDLDFQDSIGYSALHFAAQNKYYEIAEILLEKGANINIRDLHGNSPIWTAIFSAKGDNSIVKLFLERGADVTTKNNYDKSPAEMWETMNNSNIKSLLGNS